jgi:hypothetical protein
VRHQFRIACPRVEHNSLAAMVPIIPAMVPVFSFWHHLHSCYFSVPFIYSRSGTII